MDTIVLIGFTCPAITVATVILRALDIRALDRVRERATDKQTEQTKQTKQTEQTNQTKQKGCSPV